MARVMALLVASYSRERIDERTPEAYSIQLADIPIDEVRLAVLTLTATPGRIWLPTIGEIRGAVFERRLALPTPIEAWEWVQQAAATPLEYAPCQACDGTGVADLDSPTSSRCPVCGGSGDLETARRSLVEAMPDPLRRAYRAVGGASGISEGKPEVLRAQFLRAYEDISRRALASASHGSAGLEIARQTVPALPRPERRPS